MTTPQSHKNNFLIPSVLLGIIITIISMLIFSATKSAQANDYSPFIKQKFAEIKQAFIQTFEPKPSPTTKAKTNPQDPTLKDVEKIQKKYTPAPSPTPKPTSTPKTTTRHYQYKSDDGSVSINTSTTTSTSEDNTNSSSTIIINGKEYVSTDE